MSAISLDEILLDANSSNIAISDGTNTMSVNADGSINTTISAVNLDIRDLVAASDSVSAWTKDGSGTSITSTVVGADTGLDVNIIGGVAIDVDLDHANDSVKIGDGTDFLGVYLEDDASSGGEAGLYMLGQRRDALTSPVSADGDYHGLVFDSRGRLKVTTTDLAGTTCVNTKVSVTNTAGGTQLVASALANRKYITIQNLGANDIYIKNGTGATADDLKIPKNTSATFRYGSSIDLYAFCPVAAGADVRVQEAS